MPISACSIRPWRRPSGPRRTRSSNGDLDAEFPLDIFQTGSGTSTNTNANEVIATRAAALAPGTNPHPNDHVNMCQSSNDVIPTTIHVAAYLEIQEALLPAMRQLEESLAAPRRRNPWHRQDRPHPPDGRDPVRLGDEIGGWAAQVRNARARIESSLPRLAKLAQGGTAVGSGLNAHPEFGARMAAALAERTGIPFVETDNHFEAQASQDTAAEISGQLKAYAVALLKIANDLRHMNSGPIAGLGEIALPALQPGSSIMPGKINPVISEATMMVCAQVIGNDLTITIGAQHGNFELNVMLPVIAHNLLQSIELLASTSRRACDEARWMASRSMPAGSPTSSTGTRSW